MSALYLSLVPSKSMFLNYILKIKIANAGYTVSLKLAFLKYDLAIKLKIMIVEIKYPTFTYRARSVLGYIMLYI